MAGGLCIGLCLAALPAAGGQRRLCETLGVGENAYFSDSLLRQIEVRLARNEKDALERAGLHGLRGFELLKLGRLEESIAQLEEALQEAVSQRRNDDLASAVEWNLALAHLRLAEQQNCVEHRTASSCIVPLRREAVHGRPEHSRAAGDLLVDYTQSHEKNIQAVWLLNLARRLSGDFPDGIPARYRLPDSQLAGAVSFPAWRDRAPEVGIRGEDLAGGAVIEDLDGDGLLDLVTSTWNPCGGIKAYRNDGRGGFEDVSEPWGLAGVLGGLNLVHADYDGDGRPDLLLLRGAWLLEQGTIPNVLLRNRRGMDGSTVFEDVTVEAGLSHPAAPTQTAAWADYDGDGDLDLYVGNEATAAHPHPSNLFRSEGDGTFVDVALESGVTNLRYTKGTTWGDYDNDGDPDLYVSNFGPNRLYRNDGPAPSSSPSKGEGRWRFTDVAVELDVTRPEVEGFATWFFDYDNDGDLDLFVADYRSQAAQVTASYMGAVVSEGQPLLYRNELVETGRVRFTEVSRALGLTRPAMPMGANFGDLDNDGWLDFYLGTGEPDLASLMPNQMYRNTGGAFEEVTFAGGFGHLQKGHGVAFGDVDNDGDQDLLHQIGGFYPVDVYGNALFENPTYSIPPDQGVAKPPRWLVLRLVGHRANRFGIGARVRVQAELSDGGLFEVHQVVSTGGSFGSSSQQLEIGLGRADRIRELEVRWPGSGTVQTFRDVEPDRFYRVFEVSPELEPLSLPVIRLGRADSP